MKARRFSGGGGKFLRVAFLVIIILWLAALWIIGAGPAKEAGPDAIEKQFGLKPGPGRELVLANCLPCHSTAIVASNHLKRERWAELVTQMQERNGMRPLDEATRNRILDYLATAQRPDDAGLSAGKQTPWAAPLYRPNPMW